MRDVFITYTITLELFITLTKLELVPETIGRKGIVDLSEFARKYAEKP